MDGIPSPHFGISQIADLELGKGRAAVFTAPEKETKVLRRPRDRPPYFFLVPWGRKLTDAFLESAGANAPPASDTLKHLREIKGGVEHASPSVSKMKEINLIKAV